MAEIRILDKHTAELIAAGEVVERPASVVKELTENAIDAGAHAIEVEIEGGGVRKIEIRDDGCGIEPEYMHNAFVRHATSKIAAAQDLEAIHTLGFRGEALASVAGVARVTLLSKTADGDSAWRYTIAGGEELSLQEDARAPGTTITVCDLFYNTPARMKFLKKDSSEATYVQDAVEHLALSHPEISFRFTKDGKEQFFTPGDGQLVSAVRALFARDVARELVPVEYSENGMRVSGLVTPPRAARASRSMQNFYVNGRYVKNRTMMAATENAFRGLLMGGRFPGCVLLLQLPPQSVDVNVHPAKTEVRFAHEGDVFNAVYRAVKAAVMRPDSLENRLELDAAAGKKQHAAAPQGVQIGFTTLPTEPPAQCGPAEPQAAAPTGTELQAAAPQDPPRAEGSASFVAAIGKAEAAGATRQPLWRQAQTFAAAPEVADSLTESTPPMENVLVPPARAGRSFPRNPFAGLDIAVDEPETPMQAAGDGTQTTVTAEPAKASDTKTAFGRDAAFDTPNTAEAEAAEKTAAGQETAGSPQRPAAAQGQPAPSAQQPLSDVGDLLVLGEAFKTYVVVQYGEELCFIDKHAAHERILYEELARSYGSVAGQLLLAPVTVDLSAAEKTALLEQKDYLDGIGLSVDDFGGRSVLVREVPADIRADSVEDLVQEIAARLALGQREPLSEKTSWVLHSIACRAAVKGGDTAHTPEMLRLALDILRGTVPPFCPHGRPVILRLTRRELEKQFGRLG